MLENGQTVGLGVVDNRDGRRTNMEGGVKKAEQRDEKEGCDERNE